ARREPSGRRIAAAPIAQPAEAADLKSVQSGFESQWGHRERRDCNDLSASCGAGSARLPTLCPLPTPTRVSGQSVHLVVRMRHRTEVNTEHNSSSPRRRGWLEEHSPYGEIWEEKVPFRLECPSPPGHGDASGPLGTGAQRGRTQ